MTRVAEVVNGPDLADERASLRAVEQPNRNRFANANAAACDGRAHGDGWQSEWIRNLRRDPSGLSELLVSEWRIA